MAPKPTVNERRHNAEQAVLRFQRVSGWYAGRVAADNRCELRVTPDQLNLISDALNLFFATDDPDNGDDVGGAA